MVSKGETVFEASYAELGAVFHKKKSNSRTDTNAKNAVKSLLNWQEQVEIELVRVIETGRRVPHDDKPDEYFKPKYEFTGLNELVKALHSDSEDLEIVIAGILESLKAKYKPIEKKQGLHPLEKFRRAKNTIYTLIKQIFEFTYDSGLNPIDECEKVLDKSQKIVSNLKSEMEESQNRENFINEFENLLEQEN